MVAMSPSMTQRTYRWTDWKAVYAVKGSSLQYEESDSMYTVWTYDQPEVHICQIWKGTVPDSVAAAYSQVQNDLDKADFEASYKPIGNGILTPRLDGYPAMRPATTKPGWHYGPRYLTWTTSLFANSLHNMKVDGTTDWGDAALRYWKADGTELKRVDYLSDLLFQVALTAQCTRTAMDWHSTFNFDIVGTVFLNGQRPAAPAWGYVIAAPDIPAGSGGNIPFLDGGFPLHLLADYSFIDFHGITVKSVIADAVFKSNKFRLLVDHGVGAQITMAMGYKKFNL